MWDWSSWLSLESATRIGNSANVVFVLSLVAGVLSTIALVGTTSVKEKYWDKDRRESAERIEALKTQGGELRRESDQLRKETAEAKLALEKFKAPRQLTLEQQARIVDALKSFGGQEYALSVAAGSEPQALLLQIDDVLTKAGWRKHAPFGTILVQTDRGTVGINTLSGISIRVALSASEPVVNAANGLCAALAAEEIQFSGAKDPINIPAPEVINIMVGSKL